MRTAHGFGLIALFAALALVGCGGGGSEKKDTGRKDTDGADKQYVVKGKVVAVDAAKKSITLDHEAIPALKMGAMKMPFTLEDPKVAEGLQPGDRVEGHLKVKGEDYIITHLEKR
jgi:Cu/Ag efflux protein CusF